MMMVLAVVVWILLAKIACTNKSKRRTRRARTTRRRKCDFSVVSFRFLSSRHFSNRICVNCIFHTEKMCQLVRNWLRYSVSGFDTKKKLPSTVFGKKIGYSQRYFTHSDQLIVRSHGNDVGLSIFFFLFFFDLFIIVVAVVAVVICLSFHFLLFTAWEPFGGCLFFKRNKYRVIVFLQLNTENSFAQNKKRSLLWLSSIQCFECELFFRFGFCFSPVIRKWMESARERESLFRVANR